MQDMGLLTTFLGYIIFSCFIAFLWAPILTHYLYKWDITRRNPYDTTLALDSRKDKVGTPIMGGLLVVVTVAVITILFNWSRAFTFVPIGVMLISAFLGGLDDLLNIFGSKRRNPKLAHVLRLAQVHKNPLMRIWLFLSLPWVAFKRMSMWLGSHPGKGVQVHEKLLLQFIAGGISAWWIYWKLGENWREIALPFSAGGGSAFGGDINIGFWIVPLVIFVVIAAANSVNISDGLDGLSGGALIPTFGALGILAWASGLREVAILDAVTMGALITYTYFNVKPARFQMGDVGSLGLGALMGINAVVTNAIVVLPLLAFIFVVETLTVIIQVFGRTFLGRRIFRMAPLHHHFELIGWSEEKIVMRFWLIHLAAVIFGLWLGLH